MKKIIQFSFILFTIIVSLTITINTIALSGGTWVSGIKIQNLNPTEDATIQIELRQPNGNLKSTISTLSDGSPLIAPPNKSVEVYLPSYSTIESGQYSAVVMASTEIGSVVTTTNYPYGFADSYNSMEPNSSVYVPYVYHNHNYYSTEIFIQNTTDKLVTGNITFTEPSSSSSYGDSGSHTKTVPINIEPYGTQSFDTSSADFSDLGWFIGSAKIEASGDITVVANQTRLVGSGDIKGNVLISARGLSSNDAGTKIILPSLYKNFSGSSGTWKSGITVVNSSSQEADVTINFYSDPDSPSFSGIKTLSIAPDQSVEVYLPSTILDTSNLIPDQFKGFAVIISNVPIIATVQHTNYAAANGYGVAVGYAGFSKGSPKISLPSLYRWPSGAGVWISGIKIQNYGNNIATFNITFAADPDSISHINGTKTNITLDTNKAIELYFGNSILDGGGYIPSGWKGSALIESASSDAQLVATVIHTNYGRHVATMYTGNPIFLP